MSDVTCEISNLRCLQLIYLLLRAVFAAKIHIRLKYITD